MNRRNSNRVKPVKQQQFTLQILDLTFDIEPEVISTSGMFVKVGVLFPVRAMLEIELTYADTSAACLARVQNRRNHGVGLEFVSPSEKFRELISVAA